jgi:hypothetical protein
MPDDGDASVRALLSELSGRMPMSEEELRFRVEPLHAKREASVRVLLDALGGDTHDLAAAALHEIAVGEDAAVLVIGFRDSRRPDRARAEIAQVLTAVASERLETLLTPEELHQLSLLSIDTLLERLNDRPGLTQVIELYRGSSPGERRALLDAIDIATRRPRSKIRLGAAFDPLFTHETDESLRTLMIQRLVERSEPASARALGRWLTHSHGPARRRILEALQRFERHGVRPGSRSLEAWVSGVDTTGSFNVGISFPAALGLRDIVLACISLDTGLRAVNLIAAVSPDTTAEIGRALEEGQGIPVAPVDISSAFRFIEQARRQTSDLGRPVPDGYDQAAAYLRRPLALARSSRPEGDPPAAPGPFATLLDLPAYASWTLSASELRVPDSLAAGAPLSSRRLRWAARAALRGLEGAPAERRLIAMLRHQSGVHRLRSEGLLAARSAAAAREIEERGILASSLARRLVERSLAAVRDSPRSARTDVREFFKRRIEEGGTLRRRAVLLLDLAEALYRQVENLSERSAPSDRLTLAQMEVVALGAARVCVDELTRDSTEQPRLPGLEIPSITPQKVVMRRIRATSTRRALERGLEDEIRAATGLPGEAGRRMAAALATVARWFTGEVCLRRCRRGCLMEPYNDGRALFFSPGHPAGIELTPGADATRSPELVAVRRYLGRRIDDRIGATASFLEGLDGLGFSPRGEDRLRRRRAEDLLRRLRNLRQDVGRVEEDPGWTYGCVEETEELARELGILQRHLLCSALGRLHPRPEQFATFEKYPRALAAWRQLERQTQRLGLVGLRLECLHAAVDRLESSAPLLALLRAVADSASTRQLQRLAESAAEFWNHTPRSSLGSQTPAQAVEQAPAPSA